MNYSRLDGVVAKHYSLPAIAAEEGVGTALADKRDTVLALAVMAPVDQFDAVFDQGMQEYLDMGAQAIIDEHTEVIDQYYPEG